MGAVNGQPLVRAGNRMDIGDLHVLEAVEGLTFDFAEEFSKSFLSAWARAQIDGERIAAGRRG
jgi:hypothetical protein